MRQFDLLIIYYYMKNINRLSHYNRFIFYYFDYEGFSGMFSGLPGGLCQNPGHGKIMCVYNTV